MYNSTPAAAGLFRVAQAALVVPLRDAEERRGKVFKHHSARSKASQTMVQQLKYTFGTKHVTETLSLPPSWFDTWRGVRGRWARVHEGAQRTKHSRSQLPAEEHRRVNCDQDFRIECERPCQIEDSLVGAAQDLSTFQMNRPQFIFLDL